jgi:hypothetical protein
MGDAGQTDKARKSNGAGKKTGEQEAAFHPFTIVLYACE